MKKLVLALALAVGSLLAFAGSSSAAGQLCYDVNVQIADQEPIAQTGCQDLP